MWVKKTDVRARKSVYGMLAALARLVLVAVFLFLVGLVPASERIADWMHSGDQAIRTGNYQRAFEVYDQVLGYVGPVPVIYERLVAASLETEEYDLARMYLYALADLDGWTGERREQLRVIFEEQGATEQAAALLRASLDDQQPNPRALGDLAQHQIQRLEWETARVTLEQLVLLQPDHAEGLYWLGMLLAAEDHTLAAYYLQQAVAFGESSRAAIVLAALDAYNSYSLTDAHTYLGVTLVSLGEWPFAERAFEHALAVNSVNHKALAYRGFVRDQQGRNGLPDLEAALAIAPNDPTVYYLSGQHWRMAEDHRAAYEAFFQAYSLDPDNPALAAEIGTSLQNESDLVAAEEWFRTAVELAPDDVQWRRLLAGFYADTGFQLETGGLEFIQEAHRLAPNDVHIWTSLGWAYYQTGDIEKAYEELNAVIGVYPSDPRSRYYFAVVLEHQGDRDGAADSYWFVVQQLGADSGFGVLAARALQRLGYMPA